MIQHILFFLLRLVFRLQQRVDSAGGQLGKRRVGGRKQGQRCGAAQGVEEARNAHCSDQRGECLGHGHKRGPNGVRLCQHRVNDVDDPVGGLDIESRHHGVVDH